MRLPAINNMTSVMMLNKKSLFCSNSYFSHDVTVTCSSSDAATVPFPAFDASGQGQ